MVATVLEIADSNPFPVEDILITYIVPIHKMTGRLNSLFLSFESLPKNGACVIVVDDFTSCEATAEIESLFLKYSPPGAKLIFGKFGSPGAARNIALEYVRTPWVSFWDSDDFAEPQNAKQAIIRIGSQCEIIMGRYSQMLTSKNAFKATFGAFLNVKFFPFFLDFFVAPGLWRFIFRTDMVRELSFSTFQVGEDQLFLSEVFSKGPKIGHTNKLLYRYTVHRELSQTSKGTSTAALKDIRSRMANKKSPKLKPYLFIRLMYVRLWISISKKLLLADT